MQSTSCKIDIGHLEGGINWSTWKFKATLLLRGMPGGLDAVNGTLCKPMTPTSTSTAEEMSKYNKALDHYNKIDSSALLLLTANMSDETLKKIMRFNSSKEVWDELHRLFDGKSEDKSYTLCMEFFGYCKDPSHDITTHISKIKTIWSDLKTELMKIDESELPDILLICKILDTLPEAYFPFKSSWMLMSKTDKTIENLTTQLCAYERSVSFKNEGPAEALALQLPECVAISSTEAELVAASEAAREIVWIKRLFGEISKLKEIPKLKVDNDAAIKISHNPELHRRTKHIAIRHFYVRELVTDGEICVEYVPSEFQLADFLTKALHKPQIESTAMKIGMVR